MPQIYGIVMANRNYVVATVAMGLGEKFIPVAFDSPRAFRSMKAVIKRDHYPFSLLRVYRRDLERDYDPYYLPLINTADELLELIDREGLAGKGCPAES